MRKRQFGTGITFSTTYQQYEQIQESAHEQCLSSSEFIRNVLADYFDNDQQKGEMPMDE